MAYPVTYTFASANTTYVCALQQRVGSGALTLNGSGVDATSTYLLNNPRMTLTGSGFERTISLTSGGNLSGVNFTVTGKDIRGAAKAETLAGPNSNTVYTTGYFYEVTSVAVSATIASDVSVGIGTTGRSQWYVVDYLIAPTGIGLGVTVSATDLTWTIVQTTYNVQTAEPAANSIINNADSNLVSQTTSRQGNYVVPFGATRCQISGSTSGNLVFNVYQAGIT
jgi:hypothetical protein